MMGILKEFQAHGKTDNFKLRPVCLKISLF